MISLRNNFYQLKDNDRFCRLCKVRKVHELYMNTPCCYSCIKRLENEENYRKATGLQV